MIEYISGLSCGNYENNNLIWNILYTKLLQYIYRMISEKKNDNCVMDDEYFIDERRKQPIYIYIYIYVTNYISMYNNNIQYTI